MPIKIEGEEIENSKPTATSSIFKREEEARGGSENGKNDEKPEPESDWEVVEIEPQTSFPQADEEPFMMSVAQEPSVGGDIVGSVLLAVGKEEEILSLEVVPSTAIGEARIREESLSEETEWKAGTKIQTPTAEHFVPYPAFPTEQQQAELPIPTTDPIIPARSGNETAGPVTIELAPQQIEDVQEEAVMLELPEEGLVGDDSISSGEESILEFSGRESIRGTTTPLISLAQAHFEQVVSHIEPSSPTSEPDYILDTGMGVEVATLESHAQHNTQTEGTEVGGQEDFILEVSTEEDLVGYEGRYVLSEEREPVSERVETEETRKLVPAQQKSLGSEDQLDPPFLVVVLPEAGIETTDSRDAEPEPRRDAVLQKLEDEQFEETDSEVPEPSVSTALSTVGHSTDQPELRSMADPISQPQVGIEENLMSEPQDQILLDEAKWEEGHETILGQPEPFLVAPGSPAMQPLSEPTPSIHLPNSKSLIGDATNTESEPEPNVLREEEEEELKELVRERTGSFTTVSVPASEQPVDRARPSSAVSPPRIEPEPVEATGTEPEQDTILSEPPAQSTGMMEEEKG